jgi:hypothetical protein
MATITLNARAAFGYGGKQYIARITGRDSKFTFAREFIGRKSGKRGEDASVMLDEAGLYIVCDVDRTGNRDESFCLFDGARRVWIYKEEAMALAKKIDEGIIDYAEEVKHVRIETHKHRLNEDIDKDPEEFITLKAPLGRLEKGSTVRRAEIMNERRRLITELEGAVDPKASAVEKVRNLMTELGVTLEDMETY